MQWPLFQLPIPYSSPISAPLAIGLKLAITTQNSTQISGLLLPTCILVSSVFFFLLNGPKLLTYYVIINKWILSSKAHASIPWPDRLFHCLRHNLSGVRSARICVEPFEMWNRLVITWWPQTLISVQVKLACLTIIWHEICSTIRCKSIKNCTGPLQLCHSYATLWK